MRKVVVFVEGQAEQIFVRELLLRYYDYNVCIRCYKLISEQTVSAEYDHGDGSEGNSYQIINVGGDNKVISTMIGRCQGMFDSGFNLVIGLRDMYSKAYREESPNNVSPDLNREFIEAAQHSIKQKYNNDKIKIHFAIMEIETWLLALVECWKRDIPDEIIAQYIQPDIAMESIYHPAEIMRSLTSSVNNPYNKHSGQVNSIASCITKEDYLQLFTSKRCPSYNEFMKDLLGMQ